jgi:hypothetical protein
MGLLDFLKPDPERQEARREHRLNKKSERRAARQARIDARQGGRTTRTDTRQTGRTERAPYTSQSAAAIAQSAGGAVSSFFGGPGMSTPIGFEPMAYGDSDLASGSNPMMLAAGAAALGLVGALAYMVTR